MPQASGRVIRAVVDGPTPDWFGELSAGTYVQMLDIPDRAMRRWRRRSPSDATLIHRYRALLCEFYDQMRYPDRLNLGPLWYGALGRLG